MDRQTDKTGRQTRQMDRHTGSETDVQAGRQGDRQMDRQTQTDSPARGMMMMQRALCASSFTKDR